MSPRLEWDEMLVRRGKMILPFLKNKDFATLSTFVHTKKGVTFSPYSFVVEDHSAVFSAEELKTFSFGGTAEFVQNAATGIAAVPQDLSFDEYFAWFVDKDLTLSYAGRNHNLEESFPGTDCVEFVFHETGDPCRPYLWKGFVLLRLVLEKEDGEWMLVGVVHRRLSSNQ